VDDVAPSCVTIETRAGARKHKQAADCGRSPNCGVRNACSGMTMCGRLCRNQPYNKSSRCVSACEWSKRSGEHEDGAVLSTKQGVAMTTSIIDECKLFTEISPNVVR
jgi:hypothetical protein